MHVTKHSTFSRGAKLDSRVLEATKRIKDIFKEVLMKN